MELMENVPVETFEEIERILLEWGMDWQILPVKKKKKIIIRK